MRLSTGFWQTYKETPKDAEIPSHILMLRAGLIHKTAAGIYSYLPFALRIIKKIENIIREEHDKINCNEIQMSVVTPGELWKESGRWFSYGSEMMRTVDANGRDMCLSPTNEETVTDIFRKSINSYKQLPVSLYQINTKFRDEIRPRFGLMRGREFLMKDAYSFHVDKACLDKTYQDFYGCYTNIFKRTGLDFMVVEADAGAMASSDQKTHEFQVVASSGEDTVVLCKETKYAANLEKAKTLRAPCEFSKAQPLMKIETPNKKTIEDVCKFLNAPEYQSLKSLIYTAISGEEEKHYLLLLLGDDQLNEVKLKAYLKADHVMPARDNVMAELGLYKGFIGPVGLDNKIEVVFDKSVALDAAYVVGANEVDYHYQGFVASRDVKKYAQADLRMAKAGDLDQTGKHKIEIKRGIEVGHIFQLGDKYTKAMKATVLDQSGKPMIPLMGCYGIGVTRTLQAAIEQNHDENGIVWPKPIAPYHIYLAYIGKKDSTKELATGLYQELKDNGFEVLFDDRGLSPGIMFKDSDLLGLPMRIVLGERDYEATQQLEVTVRKTQQKSLVKRDAFISEIKKIWQSIT
ncbi:MAG: proline--tRNA ligase [Bacteriovoracaceae bacterium]|nr:proline--tRNA ligase [Bacteriovoracaceae bacterium]